MKMINSDIEVVSVGIGSTFDPEKGKYESGVLIVTLKDEWGTSVSVHLECGIKELRRNPGLFLMRINLNRIKEHAQAHAQAQAQAHASMVDGPRTRVQPK